MTKGIALFFALALLQLPADAQQASNSFVLSESNPYVYMVFDHVGPRTPFIQGEPDTGVWIRIVNNCRIPILVATAGTTSSGEVVVLDDVVQSGQHALRTTSGEIPILSPENSSTTESPQHAKPPLGYADYPDDTPGRARIAPGQSLLFSVPMNHLTGGDWYMRVRFSLDIRGSEYGPYSYVDSFTVHIPPTAPK